MIRSLTLIGLALAAAGSHSAILAHLTPADQDLYDVMQDEFLPPNELPAIPLRPKYTFEFSKQPHFTPSKKELKLNDWYVSYGAHGS